MTKKKQYKVVATQHGKVVFSLHVEKFTTANVVVKNWCVKAMKENEDLMFSIYENGVEIANGDFWAGDNFYYYHDFRDNEPYTVKMLIA